MLEVVCVNCYEDPSQFSLSAAVNGFDRSRLASTEMVIVVLGYPYDVVGDLIQILITPCTVHIEKMRFIW